jgi:hypothetical protein
MQVCVLTAILGFRGSCSRSTNSVLLQFLVLETLPDEYLRRTCIYAQGKVVKKLFYFCLALFVSVATSNLPYRTSIISLLPPPLMYTRHSGTKWCGEYFLLIVFLSISNSKVKRKAMTRWTGIVFIQPQSSLCAPHYTCWKERTDERKNVRLLYSQPWSWGCQLDVRPWTFPIPAWPACSFLPLWLISFFYATSLSSISIKEEAWTIVHTASTFYKRYCTETARLFLMM